MLGIFRLIAPWSRKDDPTDPLDRFDEAGAILNEITRPCFPDHVWIANSDPATFNPDDVNFMLVSRSEAAGYIDPKARPGSEIPKADFQPFHDMMTEAGISNIYTPGAKRKTGMTMISHGARTPFHVRPVMQDIDFKFLNENKKALRNAARRLGVLYRIPVQARMPTVGQP